MSKCIDNINIGGDYRMSTKIEKKLVPFCYKEMLFSKALGNLKDDHKPH
jgi:hypothetical protein